MGEDTSTSLMNVPAICHAGRLWRGKHPGEAQGGGGKRQALIEKVLVYGGSRIEVVFNYNDVFYAMLECVEQIKEAGGDD